MKRKICLLLAMLMLLSTMAIFASCDKSQGDGASTTVTTVPQGGDNGEEKVDLFIDVPTGNYEGYTFHFLNDISDYAITTIVPESTTDTVDAAMFARNSFVKEKLSIDITETRQGWNEVKSTMQSLTSSNDFEYDAVYNELSYQTPLAQNGTYLQVGDYDKYLNLKKPWWFTDAMESIAIDGENYELFSDIQLMYYESINALVFNQQDLIDNKQAFPYDLVRAGNWTLAEMEKIMKATAIKPGEEHYAMCAQRDMISAFIAGSDFVFVEQDEDDVLKIFEDEDRFVDVYNAIKDIFFISNGPDKMNHIMPDYASAAYKSGTYWEEIRSEGWNKKYLDGKATFMSSAMGGIRTSRSVEFQYGILPIPKYDTDQDKYVSWIYQGAAALCIPTTNPNLEQTCVILENLAAYSYKMVKHEYYDVVVQGRTVRDSDSIEMLDIIFGLTDLGTTRFEIDVVYNLGLLAEAKKSISDTVTEILVNIDGVKGNVEGKIEAVVEGYK